MTDGSGGADRHPTPSDGDQSADGGSSGGHHGACDCDHGAGGHAHHSHTDDTKTDEATAGSEAAADRGPATGTEPAADGESVELSVPEMDCASCAAKVTSALDDVAGVNERQPSPTTGRVTVGYDPAATSVEELTAAVESAGYEVTGRDGQTATADRLWTSRRAIRTWLGGAVLAGGLGVEFLGLTGNPTVASGLGVTFVVSDVLFLLATVLAGTEIVAAGVRSARARSLDIDFLMGVAILGAVGATLGFSGGAFGEKLYFEAATLAVLFSLAELLERYSMDRARGSLAELLAMSPDEATVVRDGTERRVPADTVTVGERVVVRPGERIPTDGQVIEGQAAVDQSPITGESVPKDVTAGDEVYAGTIAENGYLEVETTAAGEDATLSKVTSLVAEAHDNKTDREQFVERFADRYTPAVVAFAVAVTALSPIVLGVSTATAVVYGLTLLVLACPCAFVIATPVSVVSGITSAARNGVLIEGGDHLEAMGAIDTVAFDKTGTLTKGELTVTDVIGLGETTETAALSAAATLERRSDHPVAAAVVDAFEDRSDDGTHAAGDTHASDDVTAFESLTGKGVRGDLDGETYYVGKPGLFEELGFDLSHVHADDEVVTDGGVVAPECTREDCLNLVDETVPTLQRAGKTVVLVGTETELLGVLAVADEIRSEAAQTVERLRAAGVERTMLLTGDNERTARAIAQQVGIDDYRADLLPEQKVTAIEEVEGTAAMVGDGVNDAPALAAATVGVAMGAAGTDTALETADIALLSDDLSKLPYLYRLAGDATRVIRQNVIASLGLKAALAVLVPFGYVPIWLAVLAGDAGMTLGVTANAMRLARVRPDE